MCVCQVCGAESTPEENNEAEYTHFFKNWYVQRVHFNGGSQDLLTCEFCNSLSLDDLFEGYKESIRAGRIPGFH